VLTSRIPLIFLAVALTSGCAAHLRPKIELPQARPEKLKMRAALVVPEGMDQKTDDIGSFDGLGSYAVDTGQSVLPALKDMLRDTFDVVDVVKKADLAPNADVILHVKALKVVHPSGRPNDFKLRFDLRTTVTKQDGVQVVDASYTEEIEGQKKPAVGDAIMTPTEKTISSTLAKLSTQLRRSLGPPEPELPLPAEALAASPGSPKDDFSDFPPPPPPPVQTAETSPPPAAQAPAAAPAPAPVSERPLANEPLVVSKPQPAPQKGGGFGRVALTSLGVLAFVGSYLAPPLLLTTRNFPGGNSELSWVPIAGPLMATQWNPYLSTDPTTFALSIAAGVGQVVGLALVVAGVMVGTGGGSQGIAAKQASLPIAGNGWALTPTLTPNGVGVLLVH